MLDRAARLALTALFLAGPALAGPEDEVRAAFDRFIVAQNAHDPVAVRALLTDGPDFLWITRGTTVWGADAAIKRFEALYQGTWALSPDPAAVKIVPVQQNVYQLVAPVTVPVGAAGQSGAELPFLLTQLWVHDGHGWRIASLLPVPVGGAPGPGAVR